MKFYLNNKLEMLLKLKKVSAFLLLILLVGVKVSAQQDPHYTQYMYNQNVLNPAYAGSTGMLSVRMLGRTQWVGVDGAPETLTFDIHSPVGKSVGLGLSVIHDEIGPAKENNVFVDFSYTIKVNDEANLAFGLKAGYTFLDVESLNGLVSESLLSEPVNLITPNFGAGLFYYTSKFYAGLSIPNFLETEHLKNGFDDVTVSTASEKMHYFLTSGYVFDISENVKLKPSAMAKVALGAPLSLDVSLNVLFREKIEFGLSYRWDDSVSGIVGFNVNQDLRIGYAYDYTTTRFGEFNSGTHEIMLMFDFYKKRVKSPRFF